MALILIPITFTNQHTPLLAVWLLIMIIPVMSIAGKNNFELSIKELRDNYPFMASDIIIERLKEENKDYFVFTYSFTTMNKKMSGLLVYPKKNPLGVILCFRGYSPNKGYYTGKGSQNTMKYYATHEYMAISLDFFGYGSSDDFVLENSHFSRYIMAISAVELYKSLNEKSILNKINKVVIEYPKNFFMWGHSNGGQVAITATEILGERIAITLWEPVSKPWPYSMTHYIKDNIEEGKELREWIKNIFEKDYDTNSYSLLYNVNLIADGSAIQLHQGTKDYAVPISWSNDFEAAIKKDNETRQNKIIFNYYIYKGADHNISQNWYEALNRDILFFKSF